MTSNEIEAVWTIEDVSRYLRVPVDTLYQWRHRRKGPPAARIGRHLRYDPDQVRAWLRDRGPPMPIDDLWYLKKRGPNEQRLPAKRHGQGKRWRVRYEDAMGEARAKLFDRKADAEAWDSQARAGMTVEVTIDQGEARTTLFDYGERWRESRRITQLPDHRRHTESRLRHHIYPYFGKRTMRAITVTDVLEWIGKLLQKNVAQSSVKTYFDVFNALMNAAVADKVLTDNPCKAIRLSVILRGFSRVPKWVPSPEQVVRLRSVIPDHYLAAIDLGALEGCRISEVLGLRTRRDALTRIAASCTSSSN